MKNPKGKILIKLIHTNGEIEYFLCPVKNFPEKLVSTFVINQSDMEKIKSSEISM